MRSWIHFNLVDSAFKPSHKEHQVELETDHQYCTLAHLILVGRPPSGCQATVTLAGQSSIASEQMQSRVVCNCCC